MITPYSVLDAIPLDTFYKMQEKHKVERFNAIIDEFNNSEKWITNIAYNWKVKEITIKKALGKFLKETIKAKEEYYKAFPDIRSYFINSLSKNPDKYLK